MYLDIITAGVYTGVVFLSKSYISPEDFNWIDIINVWYSYVILPFNIAILIAVLCNYKMDQCMTLFYCSRYLDYITTFEILRKQQYKMLNLNVFHHATIPTLLQLSWKDKYFLRFGVFLVAISASLYTAQNSFRDLIDATYFQSLTTVQWTQYVVICIHTIRTTSKIKRTLFMVYFCIFLVLTLQYFYYS